MTRVYCRLLRNVLTLSLYISGYIFITATWPACCTLSSSVLLPRDTLAWTRLEMRCQGSSLSPSEYMKSTGQVLWSWCLRKWVGQEWPGLLFMFLTCSTVIFRFSVRLTPLAWFTPRWAMTRDSLLGGLGLEVVFSWRNVMCPRGGPGAESNTAPTISTSRHWPLSTVWDMVWYKMAPLLLKHTGTTFFMFSFITISKTMSLCFLMFSMSKVKRYLWGRMHETVLYPRLLYKVVCFSSWRWLLPANPNNNTPTSSGLLKLRNLGLETVIGKLELNDEHLLAEPASLIRICADLLTCFTTIISEENLQDCDEVGGSASAGRLINDKCFLVKIWNNV